MGEELSAKQELEYNRAVSRQRRDPHFHQRLKAKRPPMRHILYTDGDRPRHDIKKFKEGWDKINWKK